MEMWNDTIFALSSGAPPSGVSVVRVSGPQTRQILERLIGDVPSPRSAAYRTIRSRNDLVIDAGLVLFFAGPASFTGEDSAEFQVHGSKAVISALLRELASFPQTRLAMEGEFSRRAFENGKLDLVEVEGLADLIAAETEMQRRLALEQSRGGLSRLYDSWAERITRSRALIEAELDFPDEDDVPGSVSDQVWTSLAQLRSEVEDHLSHADVGEVVRDGFRVVIAGAPNAGKSSLMNWFAQRDVAIVTEIAGTTRDVLHVDINLNGYLVKLYDTAGLRDTVDVVEREGIRRAQMALNDADLVLFLIDKGAPQPVDPADLERASSHVIVGTKHDLYPSTGSYGLEISTKTGQGLPELRDYVSSFIERKFGGLSLSVPTRERHRDSLSKCLAALSQAIDHNEMSLEIRAEYLRLAGDHLGHITGHVDVEDLLGVIFSEFCIGK
ncbi:MULTISPECIES: tRNA uridine-5-carboxymethylaminomethyl(34) synthesis GTPase MnmE [unclassified Rhizobium]|uniref:tRNA uridine-5-carboxymethylaminomethyl(34) synthesis GTPase MnmE n=1 Tax=unclassified Rhizobium TaxID=2613769 RepID=UPI0010461DFF|nr:MULTISPECIES: tRNA uridine-5-carboxymethylaminomethyl(34) synthesis GTPase MnmE [unclassified Rhizobium]TCS02450.1 tRNA modification GTPase trmE [Rhizobium sp. BK418]